MKLIYGIILSTSLLVISIATNVILGNMLSNEKDRIVNYQNELKTVTGELRALKENPDEDVLKKGEEFVENMFVFTPETSQGFKKRLESMLTGEASKKLKQANSEPHDEHDEGQEKVESRIKILDSELSRVDPDKAKVKVQFEQTINGADMKAKTLNEVELDMILIKGKWKVGDYEIKQLL